jgi:CubicO group peptidase (beta-lactamase class C family)
MQEVVFEPLAMRSTVGDHSDSLIAHRTAFYERSGGGESYHTRRSGWHSERSVVLNAPFADNSSKSPGGGLLTTPEDLVRFAFAHLRPGFLHTETLEAMMTPMRTSSGEETGYGIGWRLSQDERGHRTVGHGGGSVGGTSSLLAYPEHSVVVAMQVNLTDARYGNLPSRLAWLFIEAKKGDQQ